MIQPGKGIPDLNKPESSKTTFIKVGTTCKENHNFDDISLQEKSDKLFTIVKNNLQRKKHEPNRRSLLFVYNRDIVIPDHRSRSIQCSEMVAELIGRIKRGVFNDSVYKIKDEKLRLKRIEMFGKIQVLGPYLIHYINPITLQLRMFINSKPVDISYKKLAKLTGFTKKEIYEVFAYLKSEGYVTVERLATNDSKGRCRALPALKTFAFKFFKVFFKSEIANKLLRWRSFKQGIKKSQTKREKRNEYLATKKYAQENPGSPQHTNSSNSKHNHKNSNDHATTCTVKFFEPLPEHKQASEEVRNHHMAMINKAIGRRKVNSS